MAAALVLSTLPAAPAAAKRALTAGGAVLAWVICVAITYFGGVRARVIVSETLLVVVLTDGLVGSQADPHQVRKKSGARDKTGVFCNVGLGATAMLFYEITRDQTYVVVYACAMAASLTDSIYTCNDSIKDNMKEDYNVRNRFL